MKLNRRRLLKTSLAAGAFATTQSSWTKPVDAADRPQASPSHQTDLTSSDLQMDLPDLETAQLLMQCCMLAASSAALPAQPSGHSAVAQAAPLTSATSAAIFDRHTLIASFQAQVPHFYQPQFHGVALKDADQAAVYGKLQDFGLAMRSPQHNIIALQATQTDAEWLQYAAAHQTDFDLYQPNWGQVHSRVRQLHSQLKPQIQAAIQQFDLTLPCYVTGYSLGGAIAHLAAAEIALSYPQLQPQIQVYSFGAPRLGDRRFAKFYDGLLPQTYRMVNLADRIPVLLSPLTYQHVGQARTYVAQAETLEGNHAIESYGAAIGIS